MNTPLTHRLAAAALSIVITFSLFSAVVAEAEQPVANTLLARAQASTPIVR
jgi:hypothetical protein